jgi:hypothetical protein
MLARPPIREESPINENSRKSVSIEYELTKFRVSLNRERSQLQLIKQQRSISNAATAVSVSLAQQASLADQRSVDILDRLEEKRSLDG